ncbi:MAG TPA: hypothetical protein VHM64_22295 [Candidatus Binatia bacterium]|nr:hypothetical protein [Candidatus Binatia bacterium]
MSEGVRLYAGTQEGLIIWRSTQNGWQEVARHFPDGIIDSIHGCAHSSERIFVGVTHDGLYRSIDAGKSWTKVLDGDIRSVTVDPTNDNVVYTGVEPVALFRSEDGGDQWHEITSLKSLPHSVRKNWWYPQPPHHGHVRNIHVHPESPSTIYLCLEHGGIIRSFDRGETWEDVSRGIDYLDIHVISNFPKRADQYFVASARGFFTSKKPEQGWVRAENGMTRDYFHDFIFLNDPQTRSPVMLITAADGSPGFWRRENRGARAAIFKSTNGAQSWTRVTDGLPDDLDSMIWALVHHPTDHRAVFAGFGNVARGHASGAGGAGDLMISRDMGDSWERLSIQLPADRVLWAAAD